MRFKKQYMLNLKRIMKKIAITTHEKGHRQVVRGYSPNIKYTRARIACCDRLVIERLKVQVPAGMVEECSSPELTLCADSYSVSVPPCVTAVACKRPQSFCQKCMWQVTPKHAYTLDQMKSERSDVAVQA